MKVPGGHQQNTIPSPLTHCWPARVPTGGGGTFSAPEIEIALVSSALLVVGGAALILRDRKARRKLDDDAE